MTFIKENWKLISSIIAVGGGFWYTLSPPIGGYSEGITIFAAIVIFAIRLLLKAFNKNAPFYIAAICIALSIVAFYAYFSMRSASVAHYPLAEGNTLQLVIGDTYQPPVQAYCEINVCDPVRLLQRSGGPESVLEIWTKESIEKNERSLLLWYLLTILPILSSIIFSVSAWENRKH